MDANGTWHCEIDTQIGKQQADITLHVDEATVNGTPVDSSGETPMENGRLDGAQLTWTQNLTGPFKMTLT